MPFKSEKQRKFLFANKPDVARMFVLETKGSNTKTEKKEEKEHIGRKKFINRVKRKKEN